MEWGSANCSIVFAAHAMSRVGDSCGKRLCRSAASANDGIAGELSELDSELSSPASGGSDENCLALAHVSSLQ
jgi:hypothetical protein